MSLPQYRCDGVDRESGGPRSMIVSAASDHYAIETANNGGVLVDRVTQLTMLAEWDAPASKRGVYEALFAIAKTLALFAAVCVLVLGIVAATNVFLQILATSVACFFGIVSRIFQAEEHFRGVVRRTK